MEKKPVFALGDDLPGRIIVAHNYDVASENRIHSDFTAAQYGFDRGLVPGVALYGYMTIPVVQALGFDWLTNGTLSVRFVTPVYDKERLKALATVASVEPLRITTRLLDRDGNLRAEGIATLDPGERPSRDQFPLQGLPLPADRRDPAIEDLPAGANLGSKVFAYDPGVTHDEFVDLMLDPLPHYRGLAGACHPALLVAQTNYLLMRNVDLGPWLHIGSDVRYFDLPDAKERLSLRARVAATFEKKGHLFTILDVACFGDSERPIAALTHSAIIRPRKAD